MSAIDSSVDGDDAGVQTNGADYEVGYKRPPLHTRFQPGKSGNPSGRPKGSPKLKTLFEQILKEQISLREGNVTKTITKAEAILRGLVIGALKGDPRSQMALFRLAETTGQFEEAPAPLQTITRIIVDPRTARRELPFEESDQ